MDSNHVSDLKDFLSDCIKTIKKSYPNFSSAQLAQRFDLSSSTFNRIENREIKKPTFAYALKIVREACGEEKVQNFIKNHYPEMFKDFEKTYPGNSKLEFLPVEAESYLQDATSFEVMMLASSNAGASRELINSEFGKKGLVILDALVSKDIVHEINGVYKISLPNFNFSQETVKKLLLNLVNSSYDLSAFGTHTNWLSVQYESVNREKVTPKLREVYVRANSEIRAIFNDSENAGNDVMWAILATDSLLKRNNQNNEEVIQ